MIVKFIASIFSIVSLSVMMQSAHSETSGSGAVCLATIAHIYFWHDKPHGVQDPYGRYEGKKGNVFVFSSYDRLSRYYCRVTGLRVDVSQQDDFRRNHVKMVHRYKRIGENITITTKYAVGSPDSTTFLMPEIFGRFMDMQASR